MGHKSSWSDLYIAAASEFKDEALITRLSTARRAITARLQELSRSENTHEERREIEAALTALRKLENERIPR
jgi:hypothetical protein